MDLLDLARAVLEERSLDAREWVKESMRRREPLATLSPPTTDDATLRTVCAALVELLASHRGETPPSWAATVPPLPHPLWLTPFAQRHEVWAKRCIEHGPEPLRRRGLLAMPGFLTVA